MMTENIEASAPPAPAIHQQPVRRQQPVGMMTLQFDMSSSPDKVIKILKILCWLAVCVPAGIATNGLHKAEKQYGSLIEASTIFSQSARIIRYMLSISVITMILEIVFLIKPLTDLIAIQRWKTWSVIAYNSIVILFYFVAVVLITLQLSATGVVQSLAITYVVFAGIGIAMCAVDMSIHINKERKEETP